MWWAVLLSWWLLGSLAYSCPQHCRCFTDDDGYKVANCSKSGLLSGDIAPTIDILNFKNQLRGSRTKLEARIFRNFRGVQYLNLQNSSISHLPNDVFDGLSRVVRIDLSFNKIKHLNGVVFKSVSSLRYLSLRGNFLSLSPLEVIVSDTLQELDMGLCSITNIPLHLFSSAPNLRSLTLDGNFIQNLEYNVLPKGLTYLKLANNNIIKPPINVFNSLRHLIRLDISNNPINCSCSLLVFQDTLSGRAGILENDVVCSNPPHLLGKKISAVNENQLCRDDYINREGLNSLMHSRSKKKHHIKSTDPQVQSDEPLMMDESYGAREAAEVMFTNDETNQMGTHMENRANPPPFQYSDDNKLGETMDETTPVSLTADASPEMDDTPQDMTKLDEHATASEPVEQTEVEFATSEPEVTYDETAGKDKPIASDTVVESSTSDPSKTDEISKTTRLEESDGDHQAIESANDVEILSGLDSDHHELSHLGLVDDGTTTEISIDSDKRFTLPISPTEPSDYSYDAQHDDYGVADNSTASETSDGDAKLTEAASTSTANSLEPELELDEGSGDSIDDVTEPSEQTSTIGFMEERETETESSLKTVSDDLEEGFSTTLADGLVDHVTTEVIHSSYDDEPSSTVEGLLAGMGTSTEMNIEKVESASAMPSTDSGDSVETTGVFLSSEPTSEVSSTDPSEVYDWPTEGLATESSTEPVTELPFLPVETSSEPSSTESSSTELRLIEITSPSTVVSEVSGSTASSSREPNWWDSDEVELLPSSSTSSPDAVNSSRPFQKKPKMIESTTEPSVTQDVEVMTVNSGPLDKESIREDLSRVEGENILTTGATFIIIGVLIALVLVLLAVIACKKKKSSKKIRLPTDPEAAAGTELQDMLLPKPPENGIKVLPKNYTNGTAPISNGKTKEPEVDPEETIPVLAPEPELDIQEAEAGWEDMPEPIETVTARLTMLARPQTPIFIQKPLT